MKGIVFAAGIGSRLKPFTDFHPKALATIGDKTILGLVIDKLYKSGVDDIVVNVHHFADQIHRFIDENYPEIQVSDEQSLLLDTAGGIAQIVRKNLFAHPLHDDEIVVVHNADIYTDFPMNEIVSECPYGGVSVLVDPQRHSSRQLLFDCNKMMVGWRNNTTNQYRPKDSSVKFSYAAAFGGVHAITGKVMRDIDMYVGSNLRPVSIIDYYIDNCRDVNIKAFTPTEHYKWFDIGTMKKLEAARTAILGKTADGCE